MLTLLSTHAGARLPTVGRRGTAGAPPPPPPPLLPITVTAGSVGFPASNRRLSTSDLGAWRLPNFTQKVGSTDLFGAAAPQMAIAVMVEIPWEKMTREGGSADIRFGLVGNTGTNAAVRAFEIAVVARDAVADAGALRIDINPSSTTGKVTRTLNLGGADRGLIVLRRTGGTDAAAAMSLSFHPADGGPTLTDTWTQDISADARLRSDLTLGAVGTAASPSVPASGTQYCGWIGSIGFFGVHDGVSSDADWQAIATGEDPAARLSGWRYGVKIDDPAAAPVPFANPYGLAAPTPLASGDPLRKGGDIAPAVSGALRFQADRIADGYVFARMPNAALGTVTLSGAATGLDGAAVEARVFDEDGTLTRDWTALSGGTIAGGLWSGTLQAPPNSGWGHADVRPVGHPDMVHRCRARTGVGLKIALLGQSQCEIMVKKATQGLAPAAPGPVSVAFHWRDGAAQTGAVMMDVIETGRPFSDGLATIADRAALHGNEPICVVGLVHSGTAPEWLMDDAQTDRSWQDVADMLAMTGADLTVLTMNWSTAFQGYWNLPGGIAGNVLDPMFKGVAPTDRVFNVDHWFGDGTVTSWGAMALCMMPNTRHTSPPESGALQDSSGGTAYTESSGQTRAQLLAWAAAEGHEAGLWIDDYATGGVTGPEFGPHPDETLAEGNPRFAERFLLSCLNAAGATAFQTPDIAGVARAGAALTVAVTLRGGGALQTQWGFEAGSPPAGENPVQGFEVSEDGGASWSRGGAIPFTAAITDAAAGEVTLTRGSGSWPAGVQVRYLWNGPMDHADAARDNGLLKGLLREAVPGVEGGLGLPVAGMWSAAAP